MKQKVDWALLDKLKALPCSSLKVWELFAIQGIPYLSSDDEGDPELFVDLNWDTLREIAERHSIL